MKIAKRCIACDGTRLSPSPAVLMPFIANRIFNWVPAHIGPEWGLRDLESGMAYSICNSLICDDCGMLFLDMRFDDEEMAALYRDYRGEDYTAQRDRFEPGYAARNALLLEGSGYLALIEAFLRPHLPQMPRVLDWGGDTGVNTPFRSSAARHDVYDISNRPLVAGARAVDLATAKSGEYDLLVYSNVLEHVSYPREALREIAGAMRPETVLYLEVPHENVVREHEDLAARLQHKRHWHEHINFFSSKALDALFSDVGLRTLQRKSHLITAGGKDSHVFSIAAKRES
ncbi:class I SAM-dependent methyltransferase [Methylocystis heyeri]|uniref:Methyltransferase domain-containing protein n=1 Tax=Methylocystis heyeri TaxID=391905 RepID=A0A6B8KKV5_9HYPH|nr:class I SAM-dependent methyltransferase [Methylocystis heyeri]QGM47781.1 methyltransferase domain-containing protein [Methylocystis heyeri]